MKRKLVANRTVMWVAVLLIFAGLLVLANTLTEGERFEGAVPIGVITFTLLGLFLLYRATAKSRAWRIRTRHVAYMGVGAALYTLLTYIFNALLSLSVGQLALQPQICVPILFGYVLGPVVGFFAGAVGSLLGDFVTGWGVFPIWALGSGLTGMVTGLVRLVARDKRNLRILTTVVVVLILTTAGLVFIHPRAPEPWTGEIQNFSFWAWALLVGGLVMVANRFLLEQISVALAAVNLWGTLGILAGSLFASLASALINGFSIATALIGDFAPAAATDVLNLMIFTPLVLASYNVVRVRLRRQ